MGIKVFSFHERTLIISKMIQRKPFLANPKRQDRVYQCGEYDCNANKKKNEDYYEDPCLSRCTDELLLYGKWWK